MTALLDASGISLAGRLQRTGLELRAGEIAGLIGPNGSGKTSLLHALAGIGSPRGTVRIGGVNPSECAPVERRGLLAFLPASRDLLWPVTARALIALGGGRSDTAELDRLIREFGLEDLADRRVDRLSTGERSRVLIARALLPRPSVLLLDEPASNLDPLWQLRMMDHLRMLTHSEGRATLVALHDLELARLYADRLIVMDGGAVVADGTADEILSGDVVPQVFGVERRAGRWRPVA